MRSIRLLIIYVISIPGILFYSCSDKPTRSETKKYLFHPPAEELVLMGSVLEVNDGILILVQNGQLKKIPIIIIPANDSVETVLKDAYNNRTDNQYQLNLQPWVKLTGNFLREDSVNPIFKYNYVVVLDKASEQQQVEQMEE